jgi:succinoglycan biosynthesis transport protein ExoP
MKNGHEIQIADYEVATEPEINLREYWDRIWRRKATVLVVTLAVFVLGAFWTFIQKPVYTAKSQLLIEKEPNILSFDQVLQIEAMRDDFYQTQYKLLSGRGLADTVIERLKLYENPEFARKVRKRGEAVDPTDHVFREGLIDAFLDRLSVRPVRLTRLVDVSFDARDPQLAADVVNELATAFIDLNINMKYAATEQATTFLSDQIKNLQADIQQKENQLQGLEANANIVALSDTETTVVDRLGQLNKAFTEAQIERSLKEATWNGLKNVGPDYVPEAINNQLIQRLREDYVKLKREYEKLEERYQPDYPELQRTRVEMESARKSLDDEINNLVKGSYSEFQTSLAKERSLEAEFNQQKDEAFKMNSNAVLYNGLKVEIQNKKTLLDSLLRRESETGVEARLKGLRTSNIRVVDRARVPVRPSSPNKKRNLILALLLGLGGGVGLAFLFDLLDNSVKTSEDVERYGGLPTLGVVPKFSLEGTNKAYAYSRRLKSRSEPPQLEAAPSTGAASSGLPAASSPAPKPFFAAVEKAGSPGSIELVPHYFPNSRLAESYRSIRTALLLSSADRPVKSIAFTSALPGEGKTVSVANLAITLAQSGKTVLVVDADLRRPRQHRLFKVKNTFGLTTYLTDTLTLKDIVKSTEIPSLFLVNAGPIPPNPAELLGSEKMARFIRMMDEECDFVLFDLPPMLEISDALVLGAKVDGVVLVIWGDRTSREALRKAREKLDLLKVRTLGVIINNVDVPQYGYHYYKDYHPGYHRT